MTSRRKLADSAHFEIVYKSARRCCMCFVLNADFAQKAGQIAHLDQDPTNDSVANLAWLCLPHHDEYDGSTSQSKGYTEGEVKRYRTHLLSEVEQWRQDETRGDPDQEHRYKQQLIDQNTAMFFFAALASLDTSLRKDLLARLSDADFKSQLAEAWAFIDTYQHEDQEAPSRHEIMASYIGSTEKGKEDLIILLGLAGAFISTMSDPQRNDALFALHSDTIRSALLLLNKLQGDRERET